MLKPAQSGLLVLADFSWSHKLLGSQMFYHHSQLKNTQNPCKKTDWPGNPNKPDRYKFKKKMFSRAVNNKHAAQNQMMLYIYRAL